MRPLLGLALSVGFALLVAWLGLGVAYFSIYPPGFFITTFAFGLYVVSRLLGAAGGLALVVNGFAANGNTISEMKKAAKPSSTAVAYGTSCLTRLRVR